MSLCDYVGVMFVRFDGLLRFKRFSTRDVLCYVVVDVFGFYQSNSLHWWKRTQLSYFFIWKDAYYGCIIFLWMQSMDLCYPASLLSVHRILELHICLSQLHSLVGISGNGHIVSQLSYYIVRSIPT
ncbi:hypothetical protein SFRURICE_019007 [Spodoptera frugiperda]|nr:hypothetical protein SFRURICE_019007 [Spodoptera frugiperda]